MCGAWVLQCRHWRGWAGQGARAISATYARLVAAAETQGIWPLKHVPTPCNSLDPFCFCSVYWSLPYHWVKKSHNVSILLGVPRHLAVAGAPVARIHL